MVDNEKIEHMYSASNPAIIAVLMAFLLLIIIITAVMVARYSCFFNLGFFIDLVFLCRSYFRKLTKNDMI